MLNIVGLLQTSEPTLSATLSRLQISNSGDACKQEEVCLTKGTMRI